MMTLGQQGGKIFPVGEGMGATQLAWEVMSPMRAAGIPPMTTLAEPWAIIPGPLGTHEGSEQITVWSVTRAAGDPPMRTVGSPLMMASGSAGCANGVGVGAAGWIGA